MPTKKTITKIKKTKVLVKKTVKISGPQASLFNLKGEQLGQIKLPEIFNQKENPTLLAQAIRVYQAALRQGTQSTKTRGEVDGSTRKIYRQKGTGRARHGSIKAPIFVGGGIVFGPSPRNFELKLPKTMRRQVLYGLLSNMCQKQAIAVVKGFDKSTGKTKEIVALINKLNLADKKILLVLTPELINAIRATANIENVTLRPANSLSPLDLFKSQSLIFADEALNLINTNKKS
ncbi:MAG: 50S ribosomal protein L4 [Candidatus Gottesmanbacteria bacterium GW2011_GWA1_34_13]|uniref:Large ribosomal subunit protein uL4 n=1 Tax=Candidatus Gottesmanbacteria bacterium GW2011_GWA1_34_13 TaxID=1618434 RepID=A0A0G0ASC9_9BACT|nr:MAG: 50S ribosomal protein L4 [Candidatus Gottesmanbacteria bacterium GW2011_GWA1_34_13]